MWCLLFTLSWEAAAEPLASPTTTSSEEDTGPEAEAVSPPPAGSLLLRGGRLVDGSGSPPVMEDLLIVEGRIAQRGPGLKPELAERVVELEGATVTPGLIDSHVHVTLAPGQSLFDWSRETLDEHLQHHLRAYVAAGVTTVLDCAGMWSELERVQSWMEEGRAGPRVLTLGEPPAVAGSYGPAVLSELPVQGTQEEIASYMEAHAARQPAGVKLLLEDGMVGPIWTLPELDWWEGVAREAAQHELPLFAHSSGAEETHMALQLGAVALLHGLTQADAEAEAAILAAQTPVVSTLNLAAASIGPHRSEQPDPLLELLVHPEELAAARDPETRDLSSVSIGAVATPKVPSWMARRLGRSQRFPAKMVQEQRGVMQRLHEGGVPLLLGSDAPGWPMMLDNFPAYSTLRELELLSEAGLSPEEVLRAATHAPAQLLALSQGSLLATGAAADLVVHQSDPLEDISAWRAPRYVLRAGVMKTPAEWMQP